MKIDISKMLRSVFILMGIVLASCAAGGPRIEVKEAWGRPSIKSAANAAFYMTLRNSGQTEDRLIAASSDACRITELHETSIDDQGVMAMRPVTGILLPPGDSVLLQVGGLHIMCLDRTGDFSVGDTVSITLIFDKLGELTVSAEIRE